jgi:drug/metabolite transporter (DMT)-like permease
VPIFGRRRFVVPAFALLVLFWGSAFAAIKVGLDYSPPVLFSGMRSFVGGLTITTVALVWGGRPKLGQDWRVFSLLSLLNVVLFLGLQTFAVMLLPSGTAAVVIYLQPILIGVLAWFVLGEPLSTAKLAGLLLGFSGIVAVSAGGFSGEISAAGVAFAAGSALSWALGTVYFKRVQERVSMLWAVALPFLAGGVFLSALGLAVESPAKISWSGPYVVSLLYSGFVGTGLAWVLWLGLVRAGEASRVAAYVFFVPLVSVVIGAFFLDERLSISLLVGAALVVCGIYLANRTPGEKKTTES